MRYIAMLVGVLLVSALAATPTAAAEDQLEEEHQLSMEFETPHTDWGQPYARGSIRALFFSNGRGTYAREIIELMERFDVKADAVYHHQIIDSPDFQWAGGDAGHQRMLRLLEKPYDVYIFNEIPIDKLTTEEQYKVLEPVTKGAGLVLVGVDDKRVLKPERQIQDLPPFLAKGPVGDAFTVGEGRGIRLPKRPDLPYRVGWEIEYDYWQERLGRAVLWAAGREPQMALDVTAQAVEIGRQGLPAQVAAVSWAGARAGKTKLEVSLRRWDGIKTPLGLLACERPEGQTAVRVPVVRAGDYHIDVRAISDRGVEAWATASFTVTSQRTVEAIEFDRDWGEIGESISGRVQLQGEALKNESLRVQLVDRRGRVIMRQPVQVDGDSGTFHFAIEPWMPMLLRVEAVVMDGKNEASADYRFFKVTKRNRGQFNFLVWDCPRGTLAPYAEESLARLGITLQLGGGTPGLLSAAYNIAWVPYTTRVGYAEPTFWNDDPAIQKYVDDTVKRYVPAREHGVFVYSLGDETVTRGSSTDPKDLEVYRRYLRQQYGDIEALNRSWGTDFAGFDDVVLSDPDDNDEANSLREGNYPRWYDRQAYQCWNFVQYCKRFGDAFKKIDPKAKTGFEGAGTFAAGDDLDLIIRTNGFWSPYPGTADEVVRSIAPRDFPRSNWMGYTKDADSLLSRYWRMVTRGTDAVWWWRWDGLGRFHGLLAPHLGPYPHNRDMVDDTKVVRDGLGTLLIKSKMLDDGIAILYSMPSAYANRVEQGPSYGNYEKDHMAWFGAIRGLGLQFRYVTDRMLRLGEFNARRFKVLILPQAEALGPKEADVIRAFAEGGGTVIADVRPGLYDGHCKPLKGGCLDDLFGVERGPQAKASAQRATLQGKLGQQSFSFSWESANVDPSIRVIDAQTMGHAGDTPLVIVRKVGKGQAVLLNFAMLSFPPISTAETPEAAAEFVQALFAAAGVRPTVTLTGGDGRLVRNTQIIRWRNGHIELLALFNEGMGMGWLDTSKGGKAQPAQVTLPRPMYVYDLRHHKALGRVKTFTTGIIPCRATFFALLPREAPDAQLRLSTSSTPPGKVVTARLEVPGLAGLHALRIRATTPNGQPADWLDRVVIVGRQGAEVPLPVAFNDPPGKWTIRAIDLYTEKAVGATLTVQGE